MNSASREIVPVDGTAHSTEDPPDPASSKSGHAYVDARFAPSSAPPPDYPPPKAAWDRKVYDWYEDTPFVENAVGLGKCLAGAGDLYRDTRYASGLILASAFPNIPPTPIKDPAQLDAVI